MKKLSFTVVSLFIFLAACTSTHCRQSELEQANLGNKMIVKKVKVYRYDGTLQCGMGSRISIEEMQKELKDIPVFSTAHLNDGLMRIQLCGSPTGDANVYEIEETNLEKAKALGFREWTFGGSSR